MKRLIALSSLLLILGCGSAPKVEVPEEELENQLERTLHVSQGAVRAIHVAGSLRQQLQAELRLVEDRYGSFRAKFNSSLDVLRLKIVARHSSEAMRQHLEGLGKDLEPLQKAFQQAVEGLEERAKAINGSPQIMNVPFGGEAAIAAAIDGLVQAYIDLVNAEEERRSQLETKVADFVKTLKMQEFGALAGSM